jgi:nucleotide-binding universal stress UspA family protein
LLHIIEEKAPATVHGEPHLTSASQAEAYLARIAQMLGGGEEVGTGGGNGAGEVIEQHVHSTGEHDVAASIALHVTELAAGMVALCTHGRSGLRRALTGSIAQQVLQRVNCPVLLVRPQMRAPDALRAVLVPLDGTSDGEYAIPLAVRLAEACGARVDLLNVVATLGTITGDGAATARLVPNATAAALDLQEEQSRAYLGSIVQRLHATSVRATAEVKRGDTVQNIVEAAGRKNADIIVLATHGRAGLGALWIGSVAANMIDKVGRPLLLVGINVGERSSSG